MRKLIIFCVFCILLLLGSTRAVKAQGAFLHLSPSSGSFLVGSTFSISIFLDSGGETINTVWADLKFPPAVLQVTSPTTGKSFISEWLLPPNYSNESGIISFKGGVPGGIVTSAGLVSTITFRAVASGEAKIEFSEGSRVLLHDGKGTDILSGVVNGEYQVVVPLPEGPKVFSSTHPNPNIWYPDPIPTFSWEKEEGVSDFSWSFNQSVQSRPDGVSEGDRTMVSFSGAKDGIWYFHIRQKRDGIWGKTTHLPVRIDTTPPDDFSPRVEVYSRLVGYQNVAYFETKDNLSGISRYEINITGLDASSLTQSFFTEATSPYKIPLKNPGKYNITVRAIDKAGNIKEGEARFRLITPLIIYIEGKGLEIKGILFPWWLLGILIFILVCGAALLIWWLTRRYTKRRAAQVFSYKPTQ